MSNRRLAVARVPALCLGLNWLLPHAFVSISAADGAVANGVEREVPHQRHRHELYRDRKPCIEHGQDEELRGPVGGAPVGIQPIGLKTPKMEYGKRQRGKREGKFRGHRPEREEEPVRCSPET